MSSKNKVSKSQRRIAQPNRNKNQSKVKKLLQKHGKNKNNNNNDSNSYLFDENTQSEQEEDNDRNSSQEAQDGSVLSEGNYHANSENEECIYNNYNDRRYRANKKRPLLTCHNKRKHASINDSDDNELDSGDIEFALPPPNKKSRTARPARTKASKNKQNSNKSKNSKSKTKSQKGVKSRPTVKFLIYFCCLTGSMCTTTISLSGSVFK